MNKRRWVLGLGAAVLVVAAAVGAMALRGPQVDALLEKARVETNVTTRLQMYNQAENLIMADAPVIPLYADVRYQLVKPYVKGFVVPPSVVPILKDVSIER